MFSAAMKGELGPLAQAVAKYQMERKLQRELERLRKTKNELEAIAVPGDDDKKVNFPLILPFCRSYTSSHTYSNLRKNESRGRP